MNKNANFKQPNSTSNSLQIKHLNSKGAFFTFFYHLADIHYQDVNDVLGLEEFNRSENCYQKSHRKGKKNSYVEQQFVCVEE